MELHCPECNGDITNTHIIERKFPYGYPVSVQLVIEQFPIHHCCNCGFEWYDSDAADLHDATVENYKRVLGGGESHAEGNHSLKHS
jgi:YgiT-type zinc finger domain-containing protein